ncbi:serine threonine protein kinase [Ophiostoma piceae UAMH 11346]|uniref:Serine threonine protein kinase n=1 Tax=Ophiostoma piceae (strain UAMH 11346) TaxID=1262450 RepID=S3C7I7_OPHP1|nr:serine threonine protein kinase [Ophiostoma piceae UAMH 11346]
MFDMIVFAEQFSYFVDDEGVSGLVKFVGDTSPYMQNIRSIALSLSQEDNPSIPFTTWLLEPEGIPGSEFQDVVSKMAKMGPLQRITTAEALEHPWFRDAE